MDNSITAGVVSPIVFGDDETRDRYHRLVLAARERMLVRHQVAPAMSVRCGQRVLGEGTQLQATDFDGGELRRLIRDGYVLERSDLPDSST